ncbi:MAG: 4Fe-4S dicluster domain-containing protein [Planctomycetota bacterium]|nr:4Fe-4S dicluster domain-containing protein [Planctomycetota bacterium]
MTVRIKNTDYQVDAAFAREIGKMCNAHAERCYQCMMCTAGCPVSYAMDLKPHQVVRFAQMGLKDLVLNCSTIWLCASCETCATRCPNEIEIVRVMDALRETAIREGIEVPEKAARAFHDSFLKVIRGRGRISELGLMTRLKWATGEMFSLSGRALADMWLGWRMFVRGKLKFFPKKTEDRQVIERMFERLDKETPPPGKGAG